MSKPILKDKKFYIDTQKDGVLADTNTNDVIALVDELTHHQKLVFHFHGGLVSKKGALQSAKFLQGEYLSAGAYPVFFVWESNFFRTVKDNLHEINTEDIFKALVKYLMKFAVGKIWDSEGGKATGQLELPTDIEVAIELQKADTGTDPFANVEASPKLTALNDAERKAFENALTADPDFQTAVQNVLAAAMPEDAVQESNSKGIMTVDRASAKTLMSPEIIDELRTDMDANEGKGIVTGAMVIKHAGTILVRVINRFIEKRAHGIYCTIVEEVFRELYLANVGTKVWEMMKQETADTFANAGSSPERGGWFFVDTLSRKIAAGYKPEITLVGHSAGSIYIYNLLKYVEKARANPNHPLPEDFKFKNVIFEAPALDMKKFADMLDNLDDVFEHFRMFTMDDEGEMGKPMLPVLYTRSLLYFISGVLERNYNDPKKLAYDQPIAGMQRYFNDDKTYTADEINNARKFIRKNNRRVVWSNEVPPRGNGLVSSADQHSGFAEERDTLTSVKFVIKNGWGA